MLWFVLTLLVVLCVIVLRDLGLPEARRAAAKVARARQRQDDVIKATAGVFGRGRERRKA